MDITETCKWLDKKWQSVVQSYPQKPDPEIDRFIGSDILSIRYAVLTQLLGKIAEQERSLLSLQAGKNATAGAWDPRSFCRAVIVPWVSKNQNVLGSSDDPYVSNPLRRPRLDEGFDNLRQPAEWRALADFLTPLDSANREKLESVFIRCLESVARRLGEQAFDYPVPKRVSMLRMCNILDEFISTPSGGYRPLAVTAAMMSVLGKGFSIFSEIRSQGVNEADAAKGASGDVMCLDHEGKIILSVEVKDRDLTLSDVRSSEEKAKLQEVPLDNLLFVVPRMKESEKKEIHQKVESAWAGGMNIHCIGIIPLAMASFALLDEEWRPRLLRAIGEELDKDAKHEHRIAWRDLVSKIGEEENP